MMFTGEQLQFLQDIILLTQFFFLKGAVKLCQEINNVDFSLCLMMITKVL